MPDRHTITSRDKWFLDKNMKDPITKESFKIGDTVIICAKCKTVYHESTWGIKEGTNCAVCETNDSLNYKRFSPDIFYFKGSSNKNFKIKKKISFFSSLKYKNEYPAARAAVVLLPLFYLFVFFYYADGEITAALNMESQWERLQNKVVVFNENNDEKVLESFRSLKTKTFNMGGKFKTLQIKIEDRAFVTGERISWMTDKSLQYIGQFWEELENSE